jgi:AAA domain
MSLPDRPPDVMASFTRKDEASGIVYRQSSIKDAQPFQFVWENRILSDYINLLVGIEGIGKGTLVAWVLSRLTRGELPGQLHGHPCNVAIVGDEDSFDNVWIPRIYAAGGEHKRVYLLESGPSGEGIDIAKHASAIQKFTKKMAIPVLYFDQLLDNLGYSDSWKDQHVRTALKPIRTVAQKNGLAVIATLHPNKRKGSFRDMLSGTPAFNAISRSSLLVARNPNDSERVVAVRPKGNYNEEPPAFDFGIEPHNFYKPGKKGNRTLLKVSRIYDGKDNPMIRASNVLDKQSVREREDSKANIAKAVLKQMFSDGQPRPAAEVIAEIKTMHDINEKLISTAAAELGLHKWQEGFPSTWMWSPNGRVRRGA